MRLPRGATAASTWPPERSQAHPERPPFQARHHASGREAATPPTRACGRSGPHAGFGRGQRAQAPLPKPTAPMATKSAPSTHGGWAAPTIPQAACRPSPTPAAPWPSATARPPASSRAQQARTASTSPTPTTAACSRARLGAEPSRAASRGRTTASSGSRRRRLTALRRRNLGLRR